MSLAELQEKAKAFLGAGRPDDASRVVDEMRALNPGSIAVPKLSIEIAMVREDWPLAREMATAAGRSFPGQSWWKSILRRCAEEQGELSTIVGCEAVLEQIGRDLQLERKRCELLVAQQQWSKATEAYTQLDEYFAESPAGLQGLALVSERLDDDAGLSNVVRQARLRFATHRWWHRFGGQLAESRGIDSAIEFYAELLENEPDYEWAASRIHSVLRASPNADHADQLQTHYEVHRFPEAQWWVAGYSRSLESRGEWRDAVELLEGFAEAEDNRRWAQRAQAELFDRRSDYHRSEPIWTALHLADIEKPENDSANNAGFYIRRRRADSLRMLRRYDEACELFAELAEAYPEDPAGLIGVARCFADRWDFPASRTAWMAAYQRFGEKPVVADHTVRALSEVSEFDEALRIIAEQRAVTEDNNRLAQLDLNEASLENKRFDFRRGRLLITRALARNDISEQRRSSASAALGDIAKRSQDDPALLAEAIGNLEDLPDRSGTASARLAELYVATRYFDKAERVIATELAADLGSARESGLDPHLLPIVAWRQTWRGEHQGATETANEWLSRTYRPQIHGPIVDFRRIDSAPTPSCDELIALAAVRDEMPRLPDFLRHHRRIGVDRFVFVDNGSTDGTFEYLQEQPDVILFQSHDDYFVAGMGMRWINHLLDTFVNDHWCLFLDADELFVAPGIETKEDFSRFTAYLDANGYNAVGGFMLDMHPASFREQRLTTPDELLVEVSPWFTNTYDFQPLTVSPYVDVRGGFRATVLNERYRQHTKTPLVHSASSVRFLLSSHETTPSVIADASCALLHFKFSGDANARAEKEVEWTDHFYYTARARGLKKLAADADEAGDVSFVSDDAVRYEGPTQLVQLGLIRAGGFE